LTILSIGTLIVVLYILKVKPHERELINQLELFNEIVILIITYLCWAFSDNTTDMLFKDELGWWYVFFLSLAIVTNASFIIYD